MRKCLVFLWSVTVCAFTLSAQDFTRYVDPFIGTGGTSIEVPGKVATYEQLKGVDKKVPFGGLTHPGAAIPFGMVQLGPDLNTGGFQWANGYNAYDSSMMGFSHMHTSGNGASFGVFLLIPTTKKLLTPGTLNNPDAGYRSRFSKQYEYASPGYYSVVLNDYSIKVELTATERVGFHKYTFSKADSAFVIMDLTHGVSTSEGNDWDAAEEVFIDIVNDSMVTGYKKSRYATGPVYFVAQFSKPFVQSGISADGIELKDTKQRKARDIKAYFQYKPFENEVLYVKLAVSVVSVDGAVRNLQAELPGWNFDDVKSSASKKWNKELAKIKVEGGTEDQKKIFYTALYHTMLAPFLFCDVDGKYLGSDGKIHEGDFKNYTFFSMWDTYRAVHPLFTIIHGDRVNDMMQSLVVQAEFDPLHVFPNWSVAGMNYFGMVGFPGTSVVAEAYQKGFRNFDVKKAYRYMSADAMGDKYGLQYYKSLHYVPIDKENQATAKTLEYAYNDGCFSQLAKALGETADHKYFLKRSKNYKNVFDTSTGFMRGRNSNGSWKTPFDPRAVSHYQTGEPFIESNAWHYVWSVQHDIPGLIKLMGGKDKFVTKLDQLFAASSTLTGSYSADVSGMVGQYAAGNEQCNHVAYLYNAVGQPWKTQQWVRHIMDTQYNTTPAGIPGNDDAGQLSAWYVFSAMGFYPVNPVDGNYWIGTPLFDKVIIDVGNKREFIVEANNLSKHNFYIQEVQLNDKPFKQWQFSHGELVKGGTLSLEMSNAKMK